MAWWGWVTLGVLLLIGEVLTPTGFFLFFFGLAALLIAAVVALSPDLQVWAQVLLYAVASATLVVLFRSRAARLLGSSGEAEPDTLVGTRAIASQEIAAGGTGRVELRGSVWSAHNVGTAAIQSGQQCEVVAVSGVTLQVKAAI